MRRVLMITVALVATTTLAQGARAQDGGADPRAPNAYAAAPKSVFYDVEGRLAAMESRASTFGRAGGRMMAALRQVKAFIVQQKARHGGELRDWDREAATARLNRIEAQAPELAG